MAQPSDALPYVAVVVAALTLLRSWWKDRDASAAGGAKAAASESQRLRELETWKESNVRAFGEPAVAVAELRNTAESVEAVEKEIRDLREWRARVTPLLEWAERQRSQGRMPAWRDPGKR